MTKTEANPTIPFDLLAKTLTSRWFVVGYIGFLVISFYYLDQPIALYFQSLNLSETLPWLRWVTNAGLGGPYLISLFLIALFYRYAYRNKSYELKAWFLWFCVLIPSLVCLFLKTVLGRSRPGLLFNDGIYGFFGFHTGAQYWSFPSGHTTTITGMAFGLCILFPKYTYWFIVAALTIAFSRILLTQHFLSDVLMAAYLSFIEVTLIYYWCKKRQTCARIFLKQPCSSGQERQNPLFFNNISL